MKANLPTSTMIDLENRWYSSLEKDEPDYGVYDDPSYIYDLEKCWKVYSRVYLRDINSPKSLFDKSIISDMEDVKTIVDMGCGLGYTTARLKELFPNADVYGVNLEGSWQYGIAKENGVKNGFSVVSKVEKIGKKIDLIFASEYFEHIEWPVEHLAKILEFGEPKYLLIANSFGTRAIGHFNEYHYDGDLFTPREISSLFNGCLRQHGYSKIKTKLWNQRPAYWKKA